MFDLDRDSVLELLDFVRGISIILLGDLTKKCECTLPLTLPFSHA